VGDKKILSSWKEIASYLRINIRTAQRWEKRLALPVHRMDKLDKTYVFAYADEIDKWFEEKIQKEKISKKSFLKNKKLIISAIFLIFLVSIIMLISTKFPNQGNQIPSGFKIRNSRLIIFNSAGKKLWNYDLKVEVDPYFYLYTDFTSRISKSVTFINIFFKDIDRDKKINVILAVQTKDNSNERVLCFDEKGKLLWAFKPGREIRYGNYLISPDFDIKLFRVVDLNNDGFFETIISASHKIHFPSRILVLNHKGKVIGEYWNSGHFNCVEFLDLNNDGLKEIIFGGVNNNYRKACLVVLDIRKIAGSSPQVKGTRYYSEGLGVGTEKYYILIPPNELGKLFHIYECVGTIDIFKEKRIEICTNLSRIIYEFDYQLKVNYVYLGDEFVFRYEQLKREGKINKPISSINKKKLISDILYWDGEKWTKKPTMTKFWKNYKSEFP
jgi:hypothetical protein